MEKYGCYDLGFGLHVSLDPETHEALVSSVFVVQTSLGVLRPPKKGETDGNTFDSWLDQWEQTKKTGASIVKALNTGTMTEEQAIQKIGEHNASN